MPLSRAEANYLFQVVSHRYERSSVILTSNKSVTEWPDVFGDHAIATAILDRLLHHSHVLSIKGHSYRLRERALSARSRDGFVVPRECYFPISPEIVVTNAQLHISSAIVSIEFKAWSQIKA